MPTVCCITFLIQGDQNSLCTSWLQYNRQVQRDFLITLYIGKMIVSYHICVNSSLVKTINMFTNIRIHSPSSGLNQFCWNLIIKWLFICFQLFSSHLNIKETRFRYKRFRYKSFRYKNFRYKRFRYKRFSCIYFSLPNNIRPKYIYSISDRIHSFAYSRHNGNQKADNLCHLSKLVLGWWPFWNAFKHLHKSLTVFVVLFVSR
jgi:hypothetical protein